MFTFTAVEINTQCKGGISQERFLIPWMSIFFRFSFADSFFSGKMSGRGRVWEAGCAQSKAQLFDLRENFQFCALKSFYVIKRIIIFTLFSNLEMSQQINL